VTGQTYRIERCVFGQPREEREVIAEGVSLEEAQEHCADESTHGEGWFDAYFVEG
jgi:hypothetical protein